MIRQKLKFQTRAFVSRNYSYDFYLFQIVCFFTLMIPLFILFYDLGGDRMKLNYNDIYRVYSIFPNVFVSFPLMLFACRWYSPFFWFVLLVLVAPWIALVLWAMK